MPSPSALGGVIVVMLGLPLPATAAQWSAAPDIRLTTGRNSNVRMVASEHTPVWETSLAPAVTLEVATPTDGLSADAGVNIRRFTGGTGLDSGSVLDREDYHLNTDAYHKTELNTFQLGIDYIRDSTLDTLQNNGVITTGMITREQLLENPSWTSLLNERTRMDLSLQNSTIRYRNGAGVSNLVDYDYRTASASLSYQMTQLTQGLLSGGYSSYLPDNGFDSTTLSLLAGFGTGFSETLQASIQAGQRWTTSDTTTPTGFCIGADPGAGYPDCTGGTAINNGNAKVSVDTTSTIYSASVTEKLETGSVSATLSRSSTPGSNGQLLDATRLGITCNYNFTETVSSFLKLEYLKNQNITNRTGQPGLDNKTYYQVTPRLTWNWTREWSVSGEYQYASIDRSIGGKAARNAFSVSLRYRPVKMFISR